MSETETQVTMLIRMSVAEINAKAKDIVKYCQSHISNDSEEYVKKTMWELFQFLSDREGALEQIISEKTVSK